ncbi:unnamed protein product [Ilex paraguariensis]|uniref:Uncharacterized protein n=1 Tax=Ilex paraguariensis TaxID=185542 RepID=A0ABC8UP34_9AQUA
MGSEFEPQPTSFVGLEFFDKDESLMELGYGNFGCTHYRRRCKIRAPCCDEVFDCKHCHNEAKNTLEIDPLRRHDIPRHEVTKVICSLCSTEQDVQQYCISCGVCMGKFQKANTTATNVEYAELEARTISFIATNVCLGPGCCYSKSIKDTHHCVERAMHHNCPVCFEYLFETRKEITVLRCGHPIHLECVQEMEQHYRYKCPVCSKSICDMSKLWEKLDQEVAATPMPERYQNKMVSNANHVVLSPFCNQPAL